MVSAICPNRHITLVEASSPGTEFPSVAPDVTSVGGTTLSTSSGTRGYTEGDWSSSGGGCSAYVGVGTGQRAPGWRGRAWPGSVRSDRAQRRSSGEAR